MLMGGLAGGRRGGFSGILTTRIDQREKEGGRKVVISKSYTVEGKIKASPTELGYPKEGMPSDKVRVMGKDL